MSLHVQLVPSLAGVAAGSTVVVEGDEAHHAVAVRRLRVGEELLLTDGLGATATGQVAATAKQALTVTVASVDTAPRADPRVVVVQALPKGDRGELAVAMLTELGVDRVIPWAAARSVAVWKGERGAKSLARWQATAREAAKQARRAWFPDVAALATTTEVAELIGSASLAVVLHEAAAHPLSGVTVPAGGEIVVVVGPEGGLTDDEGAAFEQAGAATVRMGGEVLRTSTAGVAAVAVLLSRTSRWH